MSPWRAVALLVWALALLGATAGFALGHAVYDRGVVYGDPGPPMRDLDGPPRAINTQLEVEADAEAQRRSLQLIREAGFGWMRQQFSWAAIEGGAKGQFYDTNLGRETWEPYDQIVRLAGEAGIRIIARLELPPAWARPSGSSKTHPPLNVQDYGDFVAAFVDRYRGRIDHIQLWNEPNLVGEWGDRPVDPAGYVELLKAGYLGAKRANPHVRVLSAMLAPTLEPDAPGSRGLNDLLYLDRMYLHGAKPYFDILAAPAYGLHTGPEDRQVGAAYTNFPRLLLTREVMLRYEDGAKAVWVTEFGWNALPPGWSGDPSPWGTVTPQQQAHYVLRAYERAQREWPWVGPMALWLFRQPRPDPRDPTAYFGLVDADWRPRPVYEALRATAAGAVIGPGIYQESAAGLDFRGTWQWTADGTASLGALRESPISGATLVLRFRGTRLELMAPVGPSRGTAFVKINGAATLANRLPLNQNGQATLDFYAPDARTQQRLLIADGLPDREHVAELTVTGQHAPGATDAGVGIDAVVVSRSRSALPALALGGAWAGTFLVGLWSVRGPVRRGLVGLVVPSGSWGLLRGWRKAGALAIAAALPLTPVVLPTPIGQFSPLELLLLMYLGACGAAIYLAPESRTWWPAGLGAFAVPASLMLLAGAVSLLVADYPHLALRELRLLVLEPVAYYFLARAALRGPRDGLALAGAFLAGASAAAGLALAQTLLGQGLVAAEGVARAAALYPSPNNLALLLGRAVPLAVALALYPPHPPRRPTPAPMGAGGHVFSGAAALCGLALYFTFSRGAWLATALALAVLLVPWLLRLPAPRRRQVITWAVLGGVPLLLVAGVLAMRVERFASLLAPEGTAWLRLYLWQSSLAMIRDHPLWGVGLDQFLYHYPSYMHPAAWREPNLSHPHNIVLDFWLRLGLLGVVALGWTGWTFVRRARPALVVALAQGGRTGGLMLGAVAAAVAMLVHGLLDNSYFVIDLAYAYWIVLLLVELASEGDH